VFQSAPINLLNERESYRDHPHSVVRTFLLSFEQIQRTNQSAIELLTACAFLAPDEIPEELLIEGAISLGPTFERMALNPFLFNSALKDLFAYSLIQRNTEKKMLSMHRLVQVVLKGRIEDAVQQEWAHRTIRAVNQAFPDNEELALWPHCQHYMLQVEACWTLIDQWNIVSVEAGHLLYRAGSYTLECAHYAQAERLLKKSLLIREDAFGVGHIVVSPNLKDLAWLYYEQGKYSEAEALLLRTLTLQEQQLCPDHLDIARSLNILALIYRARGQYSEAEALLLRALALQEQQLPPDHLDIARSLNNLALIYRAQGQYSKAEPLVLRALTIREQQLDPDHINIANSLNNLAKLSILQGRYNEAEPLLHRVLSILRRHIGAEHPLVAFSLHNLALLYQKQQLYDLAEQFHTQALVIREKALGQKHPDVANSLLLLAELALEQGHRMEAKKLYQRAIHIQELVLGSESSIVLKTKKECNAIFSSSNDGNFTSHPSSAKREKGIRSGAQRRGTDGAQRSDDLSCPQCKQKNKVVSSGENRSGSRRFRCLLCQQYFTPHMVPKGYDFVLKSRAVLLVQEGYSYRATARELGVDHHTVSRWLTREKITSTVIGDD
jgi:tetratricopeptide (TPR) repeat protein